MRGREFVMKDMYTYSKSAEELQKIYDEAIDAYMRVFERIGSEKLLMSLRHQAALLQNIAMNSKP
jgi:prolyl-tRNA synthetase